MREEMKNILTCIVVLWSMAVLTAHWAGALAFDEPVQYGLLAAIMGVAGVKTVQQIRNGKAGAQ